MQVTPVVLHTFVQMRGEQAQELGLRHVVNGEQACAWVTRVILQRRSCAGEEFDVVAGVRRRCEVAGVNCGCRLRGLRVRARRAVGVGDMAGVGFVGGRNKEVQVVLVADSSAEDVSAVGQLDVGAGGSEHNRTFLLQKGMHRKEGRRRPTILLYGKIDQTLRARGARGLSLRKI